MHNYYRLANRSNNITASSLLVSALSPNTAYKFYVNVTNSSGTVKSNVLSVTTSVTAPTAPLIMLDNITASSIRVNWSGGVGATYYDVYVNGNAVQSNIQPPVSSLVVSGLSSNTSYKFYVVAKNSTGSTNSIEITHKTAPGMPTGLSASNIATTSFILSWNAPTSGATSYEVFANDKSVGTTSSTQYVLTELTSGTSYTLYVVAKNDSGDPSAKSASYVQATAPTYTIVVVHGIMGSRLFRANGDKVWEPTGGLTGEAAWPPLNTTFMTKMKPYLLMNENGYPISGETLYTTSVTGSETNEYGAIDEYQNLIQALEKESAFKNYSIKFFAYDWRYSVAQNAVKLQDFLAKDANVIIVAHSMGGLVTTDYLKLSADNRNKVKKLITIATPYMGSAKAIVSMETGATMDDILKDLALETHIKEMSPNLPSTYELFPSSRYPYSYVGENTSNSAWINFDNAEAIGFLQSQPWAQYSDGSGTKYMFSNSRAVQDGWMYNSVTSYADLVNISYIIGTGVPTRTQVVYNNLPDQPKSIWFNWGDGDGTVIDQSASNGKAGYDSFNVDHGDLPKDTQVINRVIELIKIYINATTNTLAQSMEADSQIGDQAGVLFGNNLSSGIIVDGAANIAITDPDGSILQEDGEKLVKTDTDGNKTYIGAVWQLNSECTRKQYVIPSKNFTFDLSGFNGENSNGIMIIHRDGDNVLSQKFYSGFYTNESCKLEITETGETINRQVTGVVKTYNPNNPTTVQLIQGNIEAYRTTIEPTAGTGQVTQQFAIDNVAPGTYDLVITKAAHTKFTIKGAVVGEDGLDFTKDCRPMVQVMMLPCGDIDGDGVVSEADKNILMSSDNYSKYVADAANPLADLDGDGMITVRDLSILIGVNNYSKGEIIIHWVPLNYTVTFDSHGGSAVASQSVTEWNNAVEPTDPTKTGYIFAGWFMGDNAYNFSSAVTSDITLAVHWTSEYRKVTGVVKTYNPNNPTTIQLVQGSTEAYLTTIEPTAGTGQVTQQFAIDNVAPGTYDLVITKVAHTTFTIKGVVVGDDGLDFTKDSRPMVQVMTLLCGDVNGDGLINIDDQDIIWSAENYNKSVDQAANPLCDLNGDGLININDLDIVMSAVNYNKGEIIIHWVPLTYAITFDSQGGSTVASQSVTEWNNAVESTDPTKTGYTFAGWFLGDNAYNFSSAVTSDITLIAHWTSSVYTVTFDSQGGSTVAPSTVSYGAAIAKPTDPIRDGYSFTGWYIDSSLSALWDFATPVNDDMTLYAGWNGSLMPPTSITMSAAQTSLNMKVGAKLQLQIDVNPVGSDPNVTWSSSNPAVATVDPVTGLVTALKAGSVRITVKSVADSNVSYMFLIMINA